MKRPYLFFNTLAIVFVFGLAMLLAQNREGWVSTGATRDFYVGNIGFVSAIRSNRQAWAAVPLAGYGTFWTNTTRGNVFVFIDGGVDWLKVNGGDFFTGQYSYENAERMTIPLQPGEYIQMQWGSPPAALRWKPF